MRHAPARTPTPFDHAQIVDRKTYSRANLIAVMRIDDSCVEMALPDQLPLDNIPIAQASGGAAILDYGGRVGAPPRAGMWCYVALLSSMFFGVQLVTHSVDLIFIENSRGFDVTQMRFILGILSVVIALGLAVIPIRGGIRARLADGRSPCLHFASLGLVVAFAWWALMFFMHSLLIRCGMD